MSNETDYRKMYMQLSSQYVRDVEKLHLALKDLYNSHAGMEKSCGHDFTCVCAGDKARELIELFE